jgi:hypothetical protein
MGRKRDTARRFARAAALVGSFAALAPGSAQAQRAADVQVGTWAVAGPNPSFYSIALWRRALGPVGTTVRGLGLVRGDTVGRTLFGLGLDLTLFRGESRLAPYGVFGSGLAIEAGDGSGTAATWSAGLGLELNPADWVGFAAEARRLAEDRGLRGFWNLAESDRRGWLYSLRASLRWGGPRYYSSAEVRRRDPPPFLRAEAGAGGGAAEPLSEESRLLATQVVETAIAVMGEPYRWGGTRAEQGFDCSGLVWYAYANHGVTVPRVSREQARIGRYVVPDASLLQPGDILLFASRRDAVTHVGLYIGNDKFIHATTSGGVRVGALDPAAADANDRWWIQRWVGARRVLR